MDVVTTVKEWVDWLYVEANQNFVFVLIAIGTPIVSILAFVIVWIKGANNPVVQQLEKRLEEAKAYYTASLKDKDEKHQAQLAVLQQQIALLQAALKNPEAYKETLAKTGKEITPDLQREDNTVGREAVAAAEAAMDNGDFTLADKLFADVEAAEASGVAVGKSFPSPAPPALRLTVVKSQRPKSAGTTPTPTITAPMIWVRILNT